MLHPDQLIIIYGFFSLFIDGLLWGSISAIFFVYTGISRNRWFGFAIVISIIYILIDELLPAYIVNLGQISINSNMGDLAKNVSYIQPYDVFQSVLLITIGFRINLTWLHYLISRDKK